MTFDAYYRLTGNVLPAIEAFTREKWDVPDYSLAMEAEFREDAQLFAQKISRAEVLPVHGLSQTPRFSVAATRLDVVGVRRRIFRVQTRRNRRWNGIDLRLLRAARRLQGRVGGVSDDSADRQYVRAHPRHFRQLSDYTLCASLDPKRGWYFHPHDPVIGKSSVQDRVWKFDFPSYMRSEVLKSLDQYGLNAFSLFDNKEALLETMWLREHGFHD